jgi:hypothetical protein
LIVGVVYGMEEELSAHYRKINQRFPVIIGSDLWHRLTGKKDFYLELIDAIGEVALEVDGSQKLEQAIQNLSLDIKDKYFS